MYTMRQSNPHQRDGFPRYGYWTASPFVTTSRFAAGFGFGETNDGLTWRALPSPRTIPYSPSQAGREVGAVEAISFDRFVRSDGLVITVTLYFALLGGIDGMATYISKEPGGPFSVSRKNSLLLPQAISCYFSRFFRGRAGELLISHQSFSHRGRSYVAPFKAVEVDENDTLRLKYWRENERLKGMRVGVTRSPGSVYYDQVVNMSYWCHTRDHTHTSDHRASNNGK